MFARVTTFTGSPDQIESGISFMRDTGVPAVQKQPGFKGILTLVDRKGGKVWGATFWETEQQQRASEAAITHLRSQYAQVSAASQQPTVEVYEVAASRVIGSNATAARLTPDQAQQDKIEDTLRYARETGLPALEKMAGWQGSYLLLNRQTGRTLGLGLWEKEEHLRASQPAVGQLQAQMNQIQGGTQSPAQSEVYEVVSNT